MKSANSKANNHDRLSFVLKQFSIKRNFPLTFDAVRSSSRQKFWWICEQGHEWETAVYNRVLRNSGCPFCSNKKVLTGFNDLATTHPGVAAEWDYDSDINKDISPVSVLAGAARKIDFICPKGHHYSSSLKSRTALGTGCNVCHNLVIVQGVNDLGSFYPNLVAEWDYEAEENIGLSPFSVSRATNRKVGWVCKLGHKYVTTIATRTQDKTGCPYCGNRKVLQGFNDLASTFPEVAAEWDYEAEINKGFSPVSVVGGGRRKAAWVCGSGHRWEAKVMNRCQQKQGCGVCALNQTSRVEGEFMGLFDSVLSDVVAGVKVELVGVSDRCRWPVVDFMGTVNNVRVVVEYDGAYWHQGKVERDVTKTLQLLGLGFKVVRIREQYRGLGLGFLPVVHENLLQVAFDSYLYTGSRQVETVDEVVAWLGV